MRKISICSSGREADRGVDLEVDLELAVGGQELDVAAQRRVERGGAARRREREDREARLLLRERAPPRLSCGATSPTGAPASSIWAWVETAKRYCASPSWISRATRARSSATARPNSAERIARHAPTSISANASRRRNSPAAT